MKTENAIISERNTETENHANLALARLIVESTNSAERIALEKILLARLNRTQISTAELLNAVNQ